MFRKAALALVLMMLISAPTYAQFIPKLEETDTRDQAVMSSLVQSVADAPGNYDHSLSSLRYGIKRDKPLGQYMCAPEVEFKSDYKKLSPELQAKFAYDLHQFLKNAGYDWPTVRRKIDFAFMPYEKQNDFAQFYFLRYYPPFKDLGFLYKDGFLNDALIDAHNIYGWYMRKEWGSADYTVFEDACVQQVIKKK
jgi:hypothetical protein